MKMSTFRNFHFANSLIDMQSKGQQYSWTNKRDGDSLVKQKIDRALISVEWMLLFENAHLLILSRIGSDHGPLLLQVEPEGKKESRCLDLRLFGLSMKSVMKWWKRVGFFEGEGSRCFQLVQKHKSC